MKRAVEDLKKRLKENNLDGILVSSVANITHLTGYANFSIHEREAYILITEKNNFIFTDGRYQEAIRKLIGGFELKEISPSDPLKKILEGICHDLKINILGYEEENLTVKEYKVLKKIFKKFKPVEIFESRAVKDDYEVEQIQRACELGDKTFEYILGKFRKGVAEKEIAYEMELFIKKNGGELAFETIVAFDKNSSVPHHHTGEDKLGPKNGQFILLDFGVKINNYCSDMTRTIFWGEPSEKQKEIYKAVLEAQERAIKYINKNAGKKIKAFNIDKLVRKYILDKGFPSIPHSLGHGIGVEVHEHPYLSFKSKEILKSGMVFSIEPGIYLEDFGGVRIEDLFLFEGLKGLKKLTNSLGELIIL